MAGFLTVGEKHEMWGSAGRGVGGGLGVSLFSGLTDNPLLLQPPPAHSNTAKVGGPSWVSLP